jgi:N-methylhydantoinase A
MRYIGQEYTVTVPVPARLEGPEALGDIRKRFDEVYDIRYGHSAPAEPIQLVNLRVLALGAVAKPEFARLRQERRGGTAGPGVRRVYFQDAGGWVDCAVLRRETLTGEATVVGPAVIEEDASTTVLHPGDRASVDPYGCLCIDIAHVER